MKTKFEKFNELPAELKYEIAENLSNPDLVNLAQTSRYHMAMFKPTIDVRKFLHHVTRGKHEMVQAMLRQDISLIFKRGFVTDCSGREFENISGFEYALWALDKHMWTAMIWYIPRNDEGKKIFSRLIAQYDKVNTEGVTYRLYRKTTTEKHFDFKNTIIKELQTLVDVPCAPGNRNWDTINNQWREGVGGAQKRLPLHIVYEYCSRQQFYPVPSFTEPPISSKEFWNWTACTYENWFSVNSKLSIDFAITKSPTWGPIALPEGLIPEQASVDLLAVTALCKVRTNDFINLKSQLENKLIILAEILGP